MKRFQVLDSFRGLAAIFIVIGHMQYFIGGITGLAFFKHSGLFVEFFFILSGFVLTHRYYFKNIINMKDFIISRTFRLMPLHIVMLIVLIILEYIKLLAFNYGIKFEGKPFSLLKDLNEILPNLFLLQSWLPNVAAHSWNAPSWSISIEYYIYMIFIASLYLQKKLRLLAYTVVIIMAFGFIFEGVKIASEILRGLSCFFSGSLLYIFYKYIYNKIKMHELFFSVIEILLIISVIFLIPLETTHHSIKASLLFMSVVFIFSFEKGFISKILIYKLFLHLGKLSYSIYMIHWTILFVFGAAVIIIDKIFKLNMREGSVTNFGGSIYEISIIITLLLIIIIISNFTYEYIEVKGQNFGRILKNKFNKF